MQMRSWLQVAGLERNAADIHLPSLLHAVCVPAPMACGTVLSIDAGDTELVLRRSGVVGVLTAQTVLGESARHLAPLLSELLSPAVRHAGQLGALVVAETPQAANAAARKLIWRVRDAPARLSVSAGLASSQTAVRENTGGAPEKFASAVRKFVGTYRLPARLFAESASEVATAVFRDNGLTLFTTGALPDDAATRLGLGRAQFLSVFSTVGTCERVLGPHPYLASIAAMQFQRPVRVWVPRFCAGVLVPETVQTVQLGLDEAGLPAALLLRVAIGAPKERAQRAIRNAIALGQAYGFGDIEVVAVPVPLHLPIPNNNDDHETDFGVDFCFAIDRAVSAAAFQMKLDPLALRLRWLAASKHRAAQTLADCFATLAGLQAAGRSSRKPDGDPKRVGVSAMVSGSRAREPSFGAHLITATKQDGQDVLCNHFFAAPVGPDRDLATGPFSNAVRRYLKRARTLSRSKGLPVLERAQWVSYCDDEAGFDADAACNVRLASCAEASVFDEKTFVTDCGRGVDAAVSSALSPDAWQDSKP